MAPKLPPPPLMQAKDTVLARWCSDLYQQIKAGLIGGSASPLTTKGDVYTRDATADTRLSVGADGQVLTADSAQAKGIKWAALPAAPVTSVAGKTGAVTLVEGDVASLVSDLAAKVASTRIISTTAPLTGGGDLSADRTIAISSFTGDSGSGGAKGAVPAPAAGDAAAQKYLKADGTWATVSGGTGGGGLVLLEQHTASGVATLDFTSWLSSLYDEYIIEVVDVVPATNNVGFRMRFSTNAGSTWDSGNNYFWSINWGRLSNRALSSAGTAGSSTEVLLGITGVSNVAGNGGSKGYYRFFNPGGSTSYKLIKGETIQADGGSSDVIISDLLGKYTNSSAINGIRFFPDSGNLSSGTIRIYGLSK